MLHMQSVMTFSQRIESDETIICSETAHFVLPNLF